MGLSKLGQNARQVLFALDGDRVPYGPGEIKGSGRRPTIVGSGTVNISRISNAFFTGFHVAIVRHE